MALHPLVVVFMMVWGTGMSLGAMVAFAVTIDAILNFNEPGPELAIGLMPIVVGISCLIVSLAFRYELGKATTLLAQLFQAEVKEIS